MSKRYFIFFFLVIAFLNVFAQNIMNDTIYVSTRSTIEIIFNSIIERTVMPNGDGSYETAVSGNPKSILITALRKNAREQPLIVREGTREHKFILSFKESVPPTRMDWSDLNKLTNHINEQQRITAAKKTGVNNSGVTAKNDPEEAKKTLMEADELFKKGLWQEAKIKYGELSDPNVSEIVRIRIDEINKKLQEQKYTSSQWRRKGDTALKAMDLEGARIAYNEALKKKPGDTYLRNQLVKVSKLEAELQEKERGRKLDSIKLIEYRRAVFMGDKFLHVKDYQYSMEEYKRAGRIFKDSTYPSLQIKKINRILDSLLFRD